MAYRLLSSDILRLLSVLNSSTLSAFGIKLVFEINYCYYCYYYYCYINCYYYYIYCACIACALSSMARKSSLKKSMKWFSQSSEHSIAICLLSSHFMRNSVSFGITSESSRSVLYEASFKSLRKWLSYSRAFLPRSELCSSWASITAKNLFRSLGMYCMTLTLGDECSWSIHSIKTMGAS